MLRSFEILFLGSMQAVPYWIDDQSLQKTMVACADMEPVLAAASAAAAPQSCGRLLPVSHPLHRRHGAILDIFHQSADESARAQFTAGLGVGHSTLLHLVLPY